MATLTVGRISLSCDPERLTLQAGRRGAVRTLSLQGSFTGSTLAELKALRDELAATLGSAEIIPVTWDVDSTVDGFYQPAGGLVDLRSLTGTGMVEFRCDLIWQGDDNSVRFVSLITGDVLDNDHSYAGSGSGYVAPPVGRYTYAPASGSWVVRASEDGSIRTFLGVSSAVNPAWHVTPAYFYKGACRILTGGYVRAGVTCPNDPTSWALHNGLVKAEPTTDGALIVSHYDGAAWRATTWTVTYDGSAVGDWSAAYPLTNRPERCAVRLIRPRTTVHGSLIMDLAVRRGSRILEGVFYADQAAVMVLDTDTAGNVAGTPTGSMIKDTVDAYGHRWMIGSEKTTTLDVGSSYMAKNTDRLPFMISKEIDEGSGVQTGDEDDDLWDQYMAWRSERVRAITP